MPITAIADVRVSYTVDDKALKSATSGTIITFALWSDSACTTAVASIPLAIDDVDLIERLKRFKPKGGVRPPGAARLTEVLVGIAPPVSLFVSVSGTGITPVSGSCQQQYASAGADLPCASQVGSEVIFDGCNVNVRSGSGATDGTVNGLGNLVVGYDENGGSLPRTGSHNLVVGKDHGYASYAGLVAGRQNNVTGPNASITGGLFNEVSGIEASVSGGVLNKSTGIYASVTGGILNQAIGPYSSVSGGDTNKATGDSSSVSGGLCNVAGPGTVLICSVTSDSQSVSGGAENQATGTRASVQGGFRNSATLDHASVAGGRFNTASGVGASVSGGTGRSSTGTDDWRAGTLFEDF